MSIFFRGSEARIGVLFLFWIVLSSCTDDSEWKRLMDAGHRAMEAGDLHRAEQWIQMSLVEARRFGASDARYAETLHRLADVYYRQKRYDLAASHYWQALPAWAQSVGPEDLHMADSLKGLARIYETRGQLHLAAPLLKRALHIQEKALGFTHRKLAPTLAQYRTLLHKQHKRDEARAIEQRLAAMAQSDN